MYDWSNYRQELMQRLGELGKLAPDTMKGVVTLGAAGNKTDLLGAKVRELIALACAVTTRCDGCIAFHAEAAIKAGATDEEIAEALGVAINLNAGAAAVYSARTLDAVSQLRG
ncbi:carboxymuconolactone decarboxylase family protein [Pantoea eucalypti]|jgi:AhpD family alkylhydroperoxidase|uniref:Carboxymuconolactone decarboxylase-like domain-containing protein n=2 Tax=Pantoea TaxID=53335 RepID=A0AAX3JAF1_9GAMM|nr:MULTISPECIES: carboxymuconolactone decarboxylase family protein [Pantoea]MBW1216282.1 carboxymuconolactone decarboxylase family protein [Pantoea allii]MBW1255420.1 carboxymuconolactone decarboxylase family protein [Pantoea allii]MBW1259920.1 carboxymuconolactone decarboxylase family protein [Pantoea allii]MBW1264532.1 carboxymuconolactone decarboxylase family protein [Pantoea allii]MBW1269020.1 carboxymuconolactone decarboxylase family protein [Pantoea allii]